MGLKTNKIEERIEVTGAMIRGNDWILIRKPGQGTYAMITNANYDDEEIIIEEYSDPEYRKIWDEFSDQAAAEFAHQEICD